MNTQNKIIRPTSTEPRLSSYLNSKGVLLGLPINGTFELTARCNFNCRMCYVHLHDDIEKLKEQELTADKWLSIASDARDMGMMFLLLTGGEPFIRQDFQKIYTELIKMGIMVSINTNASIYTDEIRALFKKYPPARINVTLYGACEETYENLCGNAAYQKVVRNLHSMLEDNLQVRLNASLTPYNVCDMENIDAISKELGLQVKASAYMYPPVRVTGETGCNIARFDAAEAGNVLARWNALRDTADMFILRAENIKASRSADLTETCSDTEQEGVSCRAGRSSFWLTWDGRMLPCGTMDVEASYPIVDGFAKAWEEVRERTAKIKLPAECSGCVNRKNCGVCASICKCETGSFSTKPEYMCGMSESMCSNIVDIADKIIKENKNECQI